MTSIPCGCGDYAVEVPGDEIPDGLDAVCPECGNHFGYGPAPGGGRYEAGDLDTDARAEETITASDGPVTAEVRIETSAPSTEAASAVTGALASANRSVVDRVFGGGAPDSPPEAVRTAAAEDGGGDGGGDEDSRPMDLPGGDG